jgi:lysophospholipase L1-like esterase
VTGLVLSLLLLSGWGGIRPQPASTWLTYGDSKTNGYTWQPTLRHAINLRQYPNNQMDWRIGTPTSAMGMLARNGTTVALMKAAVDADLAAMTGVAPTRILFNLGANDVDGGGLPAEATWNANLGYILDAFRAKWPSDTVYVAYPWRRGYDADCDTVALRIDTVRSTRAWVLAGPDERVTIKGADDGAANTLDGVHYSTAGAAAWANAWVVLFGY